MFLYLIELYLLGVLLFSLLDDELPVVIRSVGGILLGLLLHVLNGLALIGVGIGLSQPAVVIAASIEWVVVFILNVNRKAPRSLFQKQAALSVLGVGAIYVAALLIFYFVNISFISNDSLYLILMGQDLIHSGFSEWYFASPGWTGPFVPMIQTMGMLFDVDYVWFIQPVFSLIFIAAFIYFTYRSVSCFISKKWGAITLVLGGLGLFLSADLPFVMLVYIHTNFSSGIFLFLAVMGLVYAIEDKTDGYLLLSLISLTSFGLLRIENVIVALTVILFTLATGKLSRKQSIKTFLPYLLIQGGWLLGVYFMQINSYLDSLSKGQILVMALACFAMMGVVLSSQWRLPKAVLGFAGKALPFVFLAGWAFLGIQDPAALLKNIRSVVTNLLISGNWGIFWWVVGGLILISLLQSQFPHKKLLVRILLSFIMVVQILGFFRTAYHAQWYDSANRMMIHIAPLVLYFSLVQVASAFASRQQLKDLKETAGKVKAAE